MNRILGKVSYCNVGQIKIVSEALKFLKFFMASYIVQKPNDKWQSVTTKVPNEKIEL